jgi:hypothetical protein
MAMQSAGASRPRVFSRVITFGIATALMIGGIVNEASPLLIWSIIAAWVFALVLLVKATQGIAGEASMSVDGDGGTDGGGGGDGGGGE